MKRNIQCLICLIAVVLVSKMGYSTEVMSLHQALKNQLLKVEGSFNESSVHYLQPVKLTFEYKGARSLSIKLEAGDLLIPEDTNYQTMMVVKGMIIVLNPNQTKVVEPYSMCIEPHDMAGHKRLMYTFNANKNVQLIEIAKFIDVNQFSPSVSQQAVWCVAERGRSLLNITACDSVGRQRLITKVANILGVKVPSRQEIAKGYEIFVFPVEESIGGSFEFNFAKTRKVHIAMFDSNGIVIRELYYNPQEKPGKHKVDFEFDYTVYQDAYYDIKLIADDKVYLSSRVNRKDENWEEE